MYIPSIDLSLTNSGLIATVTGVAVLIFGRHWYWTALAVPLMVLGLVWTLFGS